MLRRTVSHSDKERIITAHENGEDYEEVARVLGIKRGTAWSIISRYQESGRIAKPRGGLRRRKVDIEMTDVCTRIVEAHPEYTLQQIKREPELALPAKPHVCLSTIFATLHGQLITGQLFIRNLFYVFICAHCTLDLSTDPYLHNCTLIIGLKI